MDALDPIIESWRARVLGAAGKGESLVIRGGGSKDFYGGAAGAGDVLDTRACAGVIDYEPTELYITARCGTPLAEIEALLAERKQMLPFEPPHFGANATVGGMFAAGLSGPRRPAAGALRDYVLGARLLDGHGRVLRFGGQVMKNVAGYDVSRLLAGSLGTLGLVLDVTLKLLPKPVASATVRFEMVEDRALTQLNRWGGEPLPITASAWERDVLTLRLAGQRAAVDAALKRLGGERVEDDAAAAFWVGLREQGAAFFGTGAESAATDGAALDRATADGAATANAEALWRISLPTTAPVFSAATGHQLIEWGGAQRWLQAPVTAGPALRDAATAFGGHATLFRGPAAARAAGVFTPPGAALMRIHAGLKHEFDPRGVFNRARLYPEF